MSYNFWAWAQGTLDFDAGDRELSRIEAGEHAKSLTALSVGDAATEQQTTSVIVAHTTGMMNANTVDYEEEEREQAMGGAKKVASAHAEYATTKDPTRNDEDDIEVDQDARQETDMTGFHSHILPASTSTMTVSITIYETSTIATTIFVKPTTMPVPNTAATTTVTVTVTAAASPPLETDPLGLLQTVTTVPKIPMSPLDPDLGPGRCVPKGPTTSAARAGDAVGILIPRVAVGATIVLMCIWIVVSAWFWARGKHFHRAMLLVVPTMLPPIFFGCFMQEVIDMDYAFFPQSFILPLAVTLGLCACLLFLEVLGVFALISQGWATWTSNEGWNFGWGWRRNEDAGGERNNNVEWNEYTERTERKRGGREGRYVPPPW